MMGRLRTVLCVVGIFVVTEAVALVMQFPVAAIARPLIDPYLHRADLLIGFDWMATFDAVQRHPVVAQGMRLAYTSLLPVAVVALIDAAIRDPARAKALLVANAALLAIVVAVSAVWPAGSAFRFFAAPVEITPDSYIGRFEAARAGSWAPHLSGIIAFPSYHAALATLVACAVPNPIVIAMSAAIIAATPIVGGHYLVDIIAGVALAVALWPVCEIRFNRASPRA